VVETLGAFIGLQLVDALSHGERLDPDAVIRVGFAVLLGAFFIVLLPETRSRELETISPEEGDQTG
jgi:hypothetical protein